MRRAAPRGPPSPSAANLYLEPGNVTPEDLMGDIKQGLYVTELIGMGVNGVTGDYSRGAAGYWIENGKLAYPVSEVTVAGNLKDMFRNIDPGQRPGVPLRHGCADRADRRHDAGGGVTGSALSLLSAGWREGVHNAVNGDWRTEKAVTIL